MINEKIEFDEKFEEEDGSVTFYFIAPKKMLKDYGLDKAYPEAVSMEISINCPKEQIDAQHASVEVSPTIEVDGDGFEDCDWNGVKMSVEDIDALLKMVTK